MFNHVEVIKGDVRNRGNVIKLQDNVTGADIDYGGMNEVDCFQSVYVHTEALAHWFKDTSLPYVGEVWTNYFHWDFDHEDLRQSLKDAYILVERLSKYNPKNIKVFFSGNKGFHVLYMSPEIANYKNGKVDQVVKNVCCNLASDLPTFDSKIYDKTRIFRSVNSIHSATGLYKVQILKKTEDINTVYNIAKTQVRTDMRYDPTINKDILDLFETNKPEIETKSNFEMGDLLYYVANGFPEGERNTGLTSVAGMLHRRNIDDNFVEAMLHSINGNSSVPLPASDIGNIVRSISRYSIDQQFMQPKRNDIKTIVDAGNEWTENFKKYGYCRFGDRFKHIENRMKLCFPGDVIGVAAMSGGHKSTIGMELGNNEAKEQNKNSLFISLEMSNSGVFFRAATICFPLNADYIPPEEVAKKLGNDPTFYNKVYDEWRNIVIVDKGGLTIDQIVDYYNIARDEYEISNIVVDYAQNINNSEEISYSMKMARSFKTIAKQLETKLFVLMQCNKSLSNPSEEIEKNHIEGAGAYFQVCDYIMGYWKDQENKNRVHGKFLKTRWGESDYKFDLVRAGMKFHTEDFYA